MTEVSSAHPDPSRVDRVRALARSGDVTALIAMLDEPSWSLRREVVQALAALGDQAVPALCECLRTQRDNEARIAATMDALAASHGSTVDRALVALNEHGEVPVIADIAMILGRGRSSLGNTLLATLTKHEDDNIAVAAIEALGRLGGRAAVDALIDCVQSASFFRVFPAIDVLGRSGDPRAVAPLAELLRNPHYALEAARALGRTGERRAVDPLLALLTSPSDSSVRVGCSALVELSERHAQLYGSSALIAEALRRGASESTVRRLVQSSARADRAEKIALCALLGKLEHEAATPLLLSFLDGEPELAEAAAKALLDIGRASESVLLASLLEGDSRRRRALLPIVSSKNSVDAVRACLSDSSSEVRTLACDALARVGGTSAVPALFQLLADESQRVVLAAVAAIQSLGTHETEALALQAAVAESAQVRRAALRVLAYFGFEKALPIFEKVVQESDPRARDTALQGLALLELPEARALLLRTAQGSDAATRASAMRALSQLASDEELTARLLAGLTDHDAWVRYYACQALGKHKVAGGEQGIRKLLHDEAGQVRVAAVEALSHVGNAGAIDTLRSYAQDADLDMRRAALVGLGLSRDDASIALLREAALKSDAATRLVALSALANFAHREATLALSDAAHDPSAPVRVAALNLLRERPGQEAADVLVALLLSSSEREPLMEALITPLAGRVAALRAALDTADDDAALLLVSCLARSQAGDAEKALYQTLTSPNRAARHAAVSAVAALGSQEALTALGHLAASDPDEEIRKACALYLSA